MNSEIKIKRKRLLTGTVLKRGVPAQVIHARAEPVRGRFLFSSQEGRERVAWLEHASAQEAIGGAISPATLFTAIEIGDHVLLWRLKEPECAMRHNIQAAHLLTERPSNGILVVNESPSQEGKGRQCQIS